MIVRYAVTMMSGMKSNVGVISKELCGDMHFVMFTELFICVCMLHGYLFNKYLLSDNLRYVLKVIKFKYKVTVLISKLATYIYMTYNLMIVPSLYF